MNKDLSNIRNKSTLKNQKHLHSSINKEPINKNRKLRKQRHGDYGAVNMSVKKIHS